MDAVTRPILPSADLDATASFYGVLGFSVVGRWPAYLIVRGPLGIELHFWTNPHVDRWTNDVACWIGLPTPGAVTALHQRWRALDLQEPASLVAPHEVEHLWECDLIDPHGNLLRIGCPRESPHGRPSPGCGG